MTRFFFNLLAKTLILTNREDGQDMVEYALLVSLIALAAIASVSHIASAVNTLFNTVSSSLA